MLLMVLPAVGAGLGVGVGLLFEELDEGGGVLEGAVEAEELLEPVGVGAEATAGMGAVAELLPKEAVPPHPPKAAITALSTPA
jgi:hypothetical protein